MSLLLGIDLGTSYFKVGVFDPAGTMQGLGRVAVPKESKHPGWFELSVDEFWAVLRRGLEEALHEAGAVASDIRGISYSSQANTFVLLDAADKPLSPLVFWTDRRAELPEGWAEFAASDSFQRTVGFRGLSREAAVVKWAWYRRQLPDVWARVSRVLTLPDYLTTVLTGERTGDASTAALLGLLDLATHDWWPEALRTFAVDSRRLARPLTPGSACGRTAATAALALGLPAGIPFAVGALDHHAAAIGAGLDVFADASVSTGTVLAALCLVEEVPPGGDCIHGPHVDGRRFYRLAFHPDGAGRLEEFRRRYAPTHDVAALVAAAAKLPPGSRPAAAPGSAAWGAHPDLAVRAMMEDIAETHRRLLQDVAAGRPLERVAATGGGARSHDWLAIMADVFGVRIVTLACPERACLGAATFAAVAAGCHPNLAAAVGAMVQAEREFWPDPWRHSVYAALRRQRADRTARS